MEKCIKSLEIDVEYIFTVILKINPEMSLTWKAFVPRLKPLRLVSWRLISLKNWSWRRRVGGGKFVSNIYGSTRRNNDMYIIWALDRATRVPREPGAAFVNAQAGGRALILFLALFLPFFSFTFFFHYLVCWEWNWI